MFPEEPSGAPGGGQPVPGSHGAESAEGAHLPDTGEQNGSESISANHDFAGLEAADQDSTFEDPNESASAHSSGEDNPSRLDATLNWKSGTPFSGTRWDGGTPEGIEERPPQRELQEREVKVVNVFQLEDRNAMFVLLQDGRGRKMPIWIGENEAVAIYMVLQKEQDQIHRPLTHDLLKNVVEKLGARIERLTIDDIWQETYYGRLVLNAGDRWIDVDCRPSDGIALALRAHAPIYVAEEVLDSCKVSEE